VLTITNICQNLKPKLAATNRKYKWECLTHSISIQTVECGRCRWLGAVQHATKRQQTSSQQRC